MNKKILVLMLILSVFMLVGCKKKAQEVTDVIDVKKITVPAELNYTWVVLSGGGLTEPFILEPCDSADRVQNSFLEIDNKTYLRITFNATTTDYLIENLTYDVPKKTYDIVVRNVVKDHLPFHLFIKTDDDNTTSVWNFLDNENLPYVRSNDIKKFPIIKEDLCDMRMKNKMIGHFAVPNAQVLRYTWTKIIEYEGQFFIEKDCNGDSVTFTIDDSDIELPVLRYKVPTDPKLSDTFQITGITYQADTESYLIDINPEDIPEDLFTLSIHLDGTARLEGVAFNIDDMFVNPTAIEKYQIYKPTASECIEFLEE